MNQKYLSGLGVGSQGSGVRGQFWMVHKGPGAMADAAGSLSQGDSPRPQAGQKEKGTYCW